MLSLLWEVEFALLFIETIPKAAIFHPLLFTVF